MRATLLGMGLLERGSSLASLAGYAREARQGDGRLVLVAGEAGVGKSALVEQFQCDLPNARWSWGACDGLFTPRPLSEELLRRSGTSPINRINPLTILGKIRARRGAPGYWECLDEAAAAADGSGEPQWIMFVRLARAEAYWLEGQPDPAAREAELADDVCASGNAWERGAVAAWLRRTRSPRPPRADLAEPYRLQAAGGWEQAARSWAGLGCPYDAALALHDAPNEAALREALNIFTGLGASAAADHPAQDAPARHPVDPRRAAIHDPRAPAGPDPARA
jgi:hypothetical protein